MPRIWLVMVIGLSFIGSGCSISEPPMQSSDPARKVPAIKAAVAQNDISAEKQLVADLDNDDPAVRIYAINGLERLTGQRLGYEYYHDRATRQPALKRWEAWMAAQENGGATTQSATRAAQVAEGGSGIR